MEINNTQHTSVEEESTSESSTTQLSSEKNHEIFKLEMEALRTKWDKIDQDDIKRWDEIMKSLINDNSPPWFNNPEWENIPTKDDKNWKKLLESKEFWDALDSIEKKFQISLKLYYHQMVDYQIYN